MLQQRLVTVAAQYACLVERMRGGQYADDDKHQMLSSERTIVHEELLMLTGRTRADTDMYHYCRTLLVGETASARTGGVQLYDDHRCA